MEFQDLDHIDGVSISTISANLYKEPRDDLVMFYFREGANHASVYTQSKIISENIKWNLNQKTKKVFALLVNTRNANAFTGKQGYESLKNCVQDILDKLIEIESQLDDAYYSLPEYNANTDSQSYIDGARCDVYNLKDDIERAILDENQKVSLDEVMNTSPTLIKGL